MRFIPAKDVAKHLDFTKLVPQLKQAFCSTFNVPARHHHDFFNPKEGNESTLLLMPAVEEGEDMGVKIVTVSPNNSKYDLPSIHGVYILLDAHKGGVRAILEAKTLTAKRTAAASALASSFLSRKESSSLLMIGTGALSSELIAAHVSVRPITKVYVWGRSETKAQKVVQECELDLEIQTVSSLKEAIEKVDIISCATLSKTPLINGEWLKEGQHLDFVGAYRPDMREADDISLQRASIFVDTMMATKESGDLAIPLKEGAICLEDIQTDLYHLCDGRHQGRKSAKEITFFKSVGHALEDLAAAQLVMQAVENEGESHVM